jgi:hypothetical protein
MSVRRTIGIVSVLVVTSCDLLSGRAVTLGPPVRIVVGKSDTVLVNSRAPVQLPVQVLDSAGHALRVSGLRYESGAGDSLKVSGLGRVTCARRGDAEVRVSLGALSRRFVVMCRPVKGFRFVYEDVLPLVAGGPPRELALPAVGVDGDPVSMLAATITVGDTSIAELRGLTVHPRAPGSTWVEVDIGHCVWPIGITVHEPVSDPAALRRSGQLFFAPSLRLADGEHRAWRLPRGEYRVGLVGSQGPDGARLLLSRSAMNCKLWLGDLQDYHCVALAGAAIDVRNPRPPGAGGELTGTLFAERWDLPPESRPQQPRRAPHKPSKRYCPMTR